MYKQKKDLQDCRETTKLHTWAVKVENKMHCLEIIPGDEMSMKLKTSKDRNNVEDMSFT